MTGDLERAAMMLCWAESAGMEERPVPEELWEAQPEALRGGYRLSVRYVVQALQQPSERLLQAIGRDTAAPALYRWQATLRHILDEAR
jgi:hypothetical protein